MTMTLLQLVNAAQSELGLFPVASTVVGNSDQTVTQLLALANALGRSLSTATDWAALQRTYTIQSTNVITTTGDTTLDSANLNNVSGITSITSGRWLVTGAGIPSAARVLVYNTASPTNVVMDTRANATATGVTLQFSQDRYDLPSDFVYMINQTNWDRTNHWPMIGPISPQEDEWIRSGVVTTGPRRRFRITSIINNDSVSVQKVFEVWPPPGSQDAQMTWAFEYVSNGWVRNLSGLGVVQALTAFTADDQVTIFRDQMFIAGLKARLWQIKGFDATQLQAEYEALRQRAIATDKGGRTLDMRRRKTPYFLVPGNVQDANFPGP